MTASPSSESPAVMQVLGADPWMRFDLWSNRAWEAAQGAITVVTNDPSINEHALDDRAITFFHASDCAQNFAAMVNPLFALSGTKCDGGSDAVKHVGLTPEMFIDEETE